MTVAFAPATKASAKLRLALLGPPGSGKTYTGLAIASCLGRRVAVVDTERGSASKYADLCNFDVLELTSFHPMRYVEALAAAAKAAYDVVLIDSLSHAWIGKDGGLDLHDQAVARQKTKNTYTAWGEVTPHHMALIEALIQAPLHVIGTMRTKMDYIQEKDASGRTTVRKVGMAPLMRDGIEYEFDLVGDLDQDNTLVITKSRCSALAGAVIKKPGRELADKLKEWLGQSPAAGSNRQPAPPLASSTTPWPKNPNAAAPDNTTIVSGQAHGQLVSLLSASPLTGEQWNAFCGAANLSQLPARLYEAASLVIRTAPDLQKLLAYYKAPNLLALTDEQADHLAGSLISRIKKPEAAQ